jgi:hypothetical protein
VPKIYLMGFRGTGNFKSPKYRDKPGLIKAGHVGIQLEGDGRIFGFSPPPEISASVGGEEKLIEMLLEHIAQPGTVQDDTAIFELAYQLNQQGERTEVLSLELEVSIEAFEDIKQQLLEWYDTQRTSLYNLPFEDGTFREGECNCAIFPNLIGVQIPTKNGNLRHYLEVMLEEGAVLWQPPDK